MLKTFNFTLAQSSAFGSGFHPSTGAREIVEVDLGIWIQALIIIFVLVIWLYRTLVKQANR